MIPTAIFARYARALADVSIQDRTEDGVAGDLQTYARIFAAVPDLLPAFDSPAVPREAKEKLLTELLARYPVSETTANFLRVLLSHHRLRYFPEIRALFIRTLNERRGIVSAQVKTADPLTEVELEQLRQTLARVTGRTVTLEIRMDPELLGGLIVQVGSTVYDGSVRSQLEEVRKSLTGA